jgi:hypothetical protein
MFESLLYVLSNQMQLAVYLEAVLAMDTWCDGADGTHVPTGLHGCVFR